MRLTATSSFLFSRYLSRGAAAGEGYVTDHDCGISPATDEGKAEDWQTYKLSRSHAFFDWKDGVGAVVRGDSRESRVSWLVRKGAQSSAMMRVKRSSSPEDTLRPVIGGQASLGRCRDVALPSASQRCVRNKPATNEEDTTIFGAPPPSSNQDCSPKKRPVVHEEVFECSSNAGVDEGSETPVLVPPEFGMECKVRFDGVDYYAATITRVSKISSIGDGDGEDFWYITSKCPRSASLFCTMS